MKAYWALEGCHFIARLPFQPTFLDLSILFVNNAGVRYDSVGISTQMLHEGLYLQCDQQQFTSCLPLDSLAQIAS